MSNNLDAKEVTQNTNSNYVQHNTGLAQAIAAVSDQTSIAVTDADVDLTTGSNQTVTSNIYKALRSVYLKFTGTMDDDHNVILPTNKKLYFIEHACAGGFTITVKTAAGSGVDIDNGDIALVRCDGTNVVLIGAFAGVAGGDVVGPGSATDGVPALFDGTTGKLIKNSTPTGSGDPVLANSPQLSGTATYDLHPTFGADTEIVDKKYVDDAIAVAGGYTDEQAQDAVGGILDDGGDIDFTYDDATPKITGAVKSGAVTVAKLATGAKTGTIKFNFDGGGSVLTTGDKGPGAEIYVPIAITITKATLVADQSGSIVIDVWADSYANYPPTVADTITASAKPTLSSAQKSQDSTLTGWTTSISAGTFLRCKIDSVTTITGAALYLDYTKA